MKSATMSPAKFVIAVGIAASMAASAQAQSYSLIDLTPNAANGVAGGISQGVSAGYSSSVIFGSATRAMLWDATGAVDLHPAVLDNAATGAMGRSAALDNSGTLQVGWGAGAITGNRTFPMAWRSTADSAALLTIPFANVGGQALATDGNQIGGYASPLNRDGTTLGPTRAMLWDVASGTPVDLGDGGGGAQVYGAGGGQQVGYVVKSAGNAALWSGSAKSLVVLHPAGAVNSFAYATDGSRQVGYAGYDVRVRVEAFKGQKTARFYYATVWNGTAASAQNIHTVPVNAMAGISLSHSYAQGIGGSVIVGYGGDQAKFGTPAYSHALVWDASLNYQATDLNAFLPAGFVGAQAMSVDSQGNICGFMSKADGTRHAVVWVLNPAQ